MDEKPSVVDRCESHNLAVGPDGACVLCRRERSGTGAPARWHGQAAIAAALGVTLLGAVAFARGRSRQPPPQTPPTETGAARVEATTPVPAEAPPVLEDPVRPQPVPPPVVQRPTPEPQSPQRNYLDEAYAAIDKRHLYDNGTPAQPSGGKSGGSCVPVQRVYYGGRPGYGVPGYGASMPPVSRTGPRH
jgi:hypothetical protein